MPLHAAARHGSTAVVALLLGLGESANATTTVRHGSELCRRALH
jgi:ankyrin repeat protein